jgi:hypothetical protein
MTNPGIFVPFYGLSLMSKLMSVMSRVNDTDVPNNGNGGTIGSELKDGIFSVIVRFHV